MLVDVERKVGVENSDEGSYSGEEPSNVVMYVGHMGWALCNYSYRPKLEYLALLDLAHCVALDAVVALCLNKLGLVIKYVVVVVDAVIVIVIVLIYPFLVFPVLAYPVLINKHLIDPLVINWLLLWSSPPLALLNQPLTLMLCSQKPPCLLASKVGEHFGSGTILFEAL